MPYLCHVGDMKAPRTFRILIKEPVWGWYTALGDWPGAEKGWDAPTMTLTHKSVGLTAEEESCKRQSLPSFRDRRTRRLSRERSWAQVTVMSHGSRSV